jgi:hypothetical protein
MPTSALEPLTILAPSPLSETNGAGGEQCGCGCGCGVSLTQLTLPQDLVARRGDTDHPSGACNAPPIRKPHDPALLGMCLTGLGLISMLAYTTCYVIARR